MKTLRFKLITFFFRFDLKKLFTYSSGFDGGRLAKSGTKAVVQCLDVKFLSMKYIDRFLFEDSQHDKS